MKVAIAGAHGQIARHLIPLLVADGHGVVGLIRNPDHGADLAALGAAAVLCDLESASVEAVAAALDGVDAAVFAAGAGPGSGAARKLTMDRDGAIKLLAAARQAGVERYVMVSAVGAEDPPGGEQVFSVYLRAKAEADAALRASDRRWTILRPGGLTDAPASGCARIDRDPFRGQVSRADVAAVLAAVLADPRTEGTVLYVNGGERSIGEALEAALVAAPS